MDRGEHSRKNDSQDEEKPLKKARYLWEVKGKGHLKDSGEAPVPDDSSSSQEAPTTNPENCCRNFILAQSEDIMDRDISEDEESHSLETPVTLVSAQAKDQDYFLRKWHARQVARGFVDNTINSMLENWIDRPFDPSTLVEDSENDGQVEDDAILMAIQSHGLQSGPNLRGTMVNSLFSSNSNSSIGSNVAIAGSTRSESRTEALNNNQEPTVDNLENLQKEQENELLVGSSSSSMSVDTASSISNPYEAELDFLNAAVSVAIQKKGLTYG